MRRRKDWIVLATKQANSADARVHVARQGFDVLHLMYRMKRVKGVREVKPLFPFYLLVKTDLRDEQWKSLNGTRGVRRVLQCSGSPSVVAKEHVQKFREIEDEMGYVVPPGYEVPKFVLNEAVQVRDGWMTGCTGIYRGLVGTSHERIKVLFSILGIPKTIEFSAFDIAAVQPAAF